MRMLRVLTPPAEEDLLGGLASDGAVEFWIHKGDNKVRYGVGYSCWVMDQIEELLEESKIETPVDTPDL